MRSTDVVVVHLVTRHTPDTRLDTLRMLLQHPQVANTQFVLNLGPGANRVPDDATVMRVHAALPHARFGTLALRAALSRLGLLHSPRPAVLHAWSEPAASWAVALATSVRPLLLDIGSAPDVRRLVAWCTSTSMSVVCQTASRRRQLVAAGVPAPRCAAIAPGYAPCNGNALPRKEIREMLGLATGDVAVLALPPVERHAGTLGVAWSGLVAHKARPDVRLIMPQGGRELDRIRRFMVACDHDSAVRIAPPSLSLAEMLSAADLALYLPTGPAPVDGIAAAVLAGCPIVASTAETADGLLVNERTAWLVSSHTPEYAARRLLHAIEHMEQSRRQAEQARIRAADRFSSATAVESYRRVYANLATRRPFAAAAAVSTNWARSGRNAV